MIENYPLLTISIPTFNRANYLKLNLEKLRCELAGVPGERVEVLVSDNGSHDHTSDVVNSFIAGGMAIRYIRNPQDIGSDANIAQCFNLASGKYVVIMGDDDLFADGALSTIVQQLQRRDWGVVCLRPYGYENSPTAEYPGYGGGLEEFDDNGAFLARLGPMITFISACIVNKSLLAGVDAREFCGGNLVQVYLVLRATLAAKENLAIRSYMLACKRNNSGGYDFSRVFVEEFGRILDLHVVYGLSKKNICDIERNLLLWYHPFYLLRQRLSRAGDIRATYGRFKARFEKRLLFRLWVAPIMLLPRPLALVWGAATTTIGRIINGDMRRGIGFLRSKLQGSVART